MGYQVGEWHVRHDQLVTYMRLLAQSSDRVSYEEIGSTHEQRPLIHLKISSPANLARLETLRTRHLGLASIDRVTPPKDDDPLIIWLGYSIHGNESSGANASLVTAYYLAAANHLDDLLANTIIILDPSMNPDGLSRFAQWANMHRGSELVANANHREHREAWPSGRTNHYWFDLNRDWLLLQHPESRARVAQFHRWRPNILCDFHEMGTNSTFFFQPGIKTRQNPLTPDANFELTSQIGKYHAQAFDKAGELYFSQQVFDDFYYGKGSTYPDIQGSIGILFEQASSRGHLQERSFGPLSFADTIKNQVRATLSTLKAGMETRPKLLDYQASFFRKSLVEAAKDPIKAYLFGSKEDPIRVQQLANLLIQHQIRVYRSAETTPTKEKQWRESFIIPLKQPQYRLIKSLFEPVTQFKDYSFYDISTWHFPSAFGVDYQAVEQKIYRELKLGEALTTPILPQKTFSPQKEAFAYAFDWSSYFAPRAAYQLLKKNIHLRFANQPFRAQTSTGERSFEPGAVIVPVGVQTVAKETLLKELTLAAQENGVAIFSIETGLTPEGIDLGSPSISQITQPKPAILVGRGVSAYEAGAIWHLLDQRFRMAVSLLDSANLRSDQLRDFTHLIMVDGFYDRLPEAFLEGLKTWIKEGGVLIATQQGAKWAAQKEILQVKFKKPQAKNSASEKSETQGGDAARRPFGERSQDRVLQSINGSIFLGNLDITHPMGYGFKRPNIALFRHNTLLMEPSQNPYATVIQYDQNPLISGYASQENLEGIKGTAALIAEGVGRGAVILMTDPLNFRGFWYGTNKLLFNGLFFSSAIRPQ